MLLSLAFAKLFIFIDEIFTNNPDLSSQIEYIIILENKTLKNREFKLRENILY
jgi:hypothetical protein